MKKPFAQCYKFKRWYGSSTQNIDSIIRSILGTYTNQTQVTIQINIRGMSGFDRINTMVDGVRQTFYGTADNDPSGFRTQISTSAFGVFR